ncbi:MAG: patatin-like phospholipase family protein, partial [Gammaproteobacteria bacterium]|nr:patatin-like phospholipase family protein [Gammaproteobacteria bacterium]
MSKQQAKKIAIVLGGGGSRAAYQVGVIKAIAEMLPHHTPTPFQIVCGTSAGAFNAAAIAGFANNYHRAAAALLRIWANFRTHHVLRSDIWGVGKTGAKWLAAMMLGGLGEKNPVYLFDRSPLRQLMQKHMPLHNIYRFIEKDYLHAVSVNASGYSTGESITFYQGKKGIDNWRRSNRIGIATELTIDHLMASSAIPMLFEAVKINREYFGDGSMRQIAPISSALHLGAERILVIGNSHISEEHQRTNVHQYPTLAQIAGFALDSVFLDSL